MNGVRNDETGTQPNNRDRPSQAERKKNPSETIATRTFLGFQNNQTRTKTPENSGDNNPLSTLDLLLVAYRPTRACDPAIQLHLPSIIDGKRQSALRTHGRWRAKNAAPGPM
jgi:hypothetical protein